DFGPPLSSSPEIHSGAVSTASTPPVRSFAATMAMSAPASSSWGRSPASLAWEESKSSWKLEIPEDKLAQVAYGTPPTGSEASQASPAKSSGGRKKKPQKVVLIGNTGSRGSLYH
ncbi:hypothetical protein HDU91_001101, partial [Kappamyces sp. JEL0680]